MNSWQGVRKRFTVMLMTVAMVLAAGGFILMGPITARADFVVADQIFGFNWADVHWEYDKTVNQDVVTEMRYNGGDPDDLFDGFTSGTGIDAWADHTVALAMINYEGHKTPYTGTIKVTKAVWNDQVGWWNDTGEAASADSYHISLIDGNDPDRRLAAVPEEYQDAAYYDVRFDNDGEAYCLTASDAAGYNKLFINCAHAKAAFYRTDQISKESFVQDWGDRLDLSKDEGFYFIIDKLIDQSRTIVVDGFAVYDDDEEVQKDVFVSFADFAEAYPWLTYEKILDNEEQTVYYFKGNGQNLREEDRDLKLWTVESFPGEDLQSRIRCVNVRYPIYGLTITMPWDKQPTKDAELWVSDEREEYYLSVDGEPYIGEVTIEYRFQSDAAAESTIKMHTRNGILPYAFNKIGYYTIRINKDGESDAVSVRSVATPIGFYESMDLRDRITNTLYMRKGQSKNVFIYVNRDLEEDGESFSFDRKVKARGWLDRDPESGANEWYNTQTAQDAGGGWYAFTLPGMINGYKFDSFNISAEAKAKDRTESRNLNVSCIEDEKKMIRLEDGIYDNAYVGDCTDYAAFTIYPFGAYLNFTPVTLKYQSDTGCFKAMPVTDFDLDKIRIGYWKETEEVDGQRDKIWRFTDCPDDCYTVQKNENDTITITFCVEGRFELRYGTEGDGEMFAVLESHQPDLDFYVNDTKPRFPEKVKLLTDDVIVREKKGVENDTFYVFWRVWDQDAEDTFESDVREMGAEDVISVMDLGTAVGLLQRTEFLNTLSGHVENFLCCLDPATFELSLLTESGKEISGQEAASYVTVSDVKMGNFVVGKKLVVSGNAKESFSLTVQMKRFGDAVYDRLCIRDPQDHNRIAWDSEKGHVSLKEGVHLDYQEDGAALNILNNYQWTADPNGYFNLSYDVKYVPFTALKVDKAPAKTAYTEGDSLDPAGLVVSGVYEDGSSFALSASDYKIAPADALKTSDTKAVITYKDNPSLQGEFAIKVTKKTAVDPQPETAPPAKKGETIKNTATGSAGSDSKFVVTQPAGGKDKPGKVSYAGEGEKSSATELTIPDVIIGADGLTYQVVSVAANALAGNATVKKLIIGDNVVTLGKGAFRGMKALESVKLGKSVVAIESFCFADCTKLKTFIGNAVLEEMGESVFSGCKSFKTLDLSKAPLKKAGKSLMKGAKPKTIKIYASKLKKFGKKSFAGLTKKNKILVYAKDKKTYTKVVKLLKKAGAKKAKYSWKKVKK